MDGLNLKYILEGALFAAREPLNILKMKTLFGDQKSPTEGMLRDALKSLNEDYEGHAVRLVEVAGGFRFQVSDDLRPYLANSSHDSVGKYSRATLETLAMIAYRQPVTRGEIEAVRGVAVNTQIVRMLEEREWIRVVGRKEVPGRPALFATTTKFLDDFGMKTLDELPQIDSLIPVAVNKDLFNYETANHE
ncbi:SMC-Scp complex subunit ScpB [Litorivicinus sp.]|nr:SMC-Scp complex subunit ScpB [Litorivicinus sp.]